MKTQFQLLIITLSALILLPFCKKDEIQPQSPQPARIELSASGKKLVSASNGFAFSMFQQVASAENPETNVMISPLSISVALGMTLNGSAGTTFSAIRNTLGFDQLSQNEINANYKILIPFLLNADPLTVVKIANSIWYRNDFQPKQSFLDSCAAYFSVYLKQLDFSNPASLNTINSWVAANTNNKITQLLSQLKPDDVMYLINALYFKGNWTIKFKAAETQNAQFTRHNGQIITVPTMNNKNKFKLFSNNDFSMLEMDYGRTNFSMNVLLPSSGKSTSDVINQLNASNFSLWCNNLQEVNDMQIALPKFRFEYEKSLDAMLKAMGMAVAFSDTANFTGISTDLQLLITEVKHKTFIDVNEEGTEAAAATSVGIGLTSLPPSFIANRPFIFVIREKETQTVLFIGRLSVPAY